MSGTLYLIGEIIVFMILATLVGFAVGRLTRRSHATVSTQETSALRERASLLQREVDELTAALTDARRQAGTGPEASDLRSRAAMAEREAEGLERRLREAADRIGELERERDELAVRAESAEARASVAPVEAASVPVAEDDGAVTEELDALRAELARRTEELERLEQAAREARRLEGELAARDDRIGRLESVLEASAAARAAAGDADAASIGMSIGAAQYADSRLEFDAWDPRDE